MILEGLLVVLGFFLLLGPIAYIAAAMKLMLGGILVSVIGFLKAVLGSFILLIVTGFMGLVYERSSESGSELEFRGPTYSNADIEAAELSKHHLLAICIIFLVALRFCPSLLKSLAFALFFILVVGSLAKMNDK